MPCVCREMCDCAVYNDTVTSMMRPVQLEYWRLLDELININGTYDGLQDFTVVLHPHFRDSEPPRTVSRVKTTIKTTFHLSQL